MLINSKENVSWCWALTFYTQELIMCSQCGQIQNDTSWNSFYVNSFCRYGPKTHAFWLLRDLDLWCLANTHLLVEINMCQTIVLDLHQLNPEWNISRTCSSEDVSSHQRWLKHQQLVDSWESVWIILAHFGRITMKFVILPARTDISEQTWEAHSYNRLGWLRDTVYLTENLPHQSQKELVRHQ